MITLLFPFGMSRITSFSKNIARKSAEARRRSLQEVQWSLGLLMSKPIIVHTYKSERSALHGRRKHYSTLEDLQSVERSPRCPRSSALSSQANSSSMTSMHRLSTVRIPRGSTAESGGIRNEAKDANRPLFRRHAVRWRGPITRFDAERLQKRCVY